MTHLSKLFCATLCLAGTALHAQNNEKLILDFNAGFDPGRVLSGNGLGFEMSKLGNGSVKINVTPNGGWPGLNVSFPSGPMDLSAFGGISVEAYNPEDFPQTVALRVDNPGADGSKNCNVEAYEIPAKGRRTLSTWFGITSGRPGFPLNPAQISGICLFWSQPDKPMSIVIDDIKAIPPNPKFLGPAKPRERVSIDFEAGAGETDYRMTSEGNPNAAGAHFGIVDRGLGGKRALAADTMKEGKGWFEFWESRVGLLAGSFTYDVTFRYRVLEGDPGAVVYALFRSSSKGWGKWDRGWTNIENLPEKVGKTLTQKITVDLPRFNDYVMMFGVNGRAKIVIDDIVITRGAPFDDGSLLDRVKEKRNANAERVVLVDLEGDLPAGTHIAIGEITDKPAERLIGKRSLVVDTIGRGQEWNEAVVVGRGMLAPGYKYYITIAVRMEKNEGGSVYVTANNTRNVEGHGKRGWRSWNSGAGDDDVIVTTFDFRQDAGYELLIGVHGQARVLFDEIEIRREPLGEDKVAKLKVRDKATSKLIFEDTFDGTKIDETKWSIGGDMPRTGGVWRKANSTLDGKGNLDLVFKPDGDTFSFGIVSTKQNFTYGYFECRMQLPKYTGHWPGFWLFGEGVTTVGNDGRDGTEIDIVEAPWRFEDKVVHTLHWDGYGDDHASFGKEAHIPGINQGFHTFAVDWSPDGYIFLVDGVETFRTDAGGVCQVPLGLIISDEMGGWSGNPRETDPALLPDHILVDYVRVWQ